MEVGKEQGSDGETSIPCRLNRVEEYDGFQDGEGSSDALRDELDERAVSTHSGAHRVDILGKVRSLYANVDAPEMAVCPETEGFVDGLEYRVHKCCRQGPPRYLFPEDDSECIELLVVLPKALCPLVYDVRFVNKHTKDAGAELLLDVELLHLGVTKEVFRRCEYQVDVR